MDLKTIKYTFLNLVKTISIVIIGSAVGLELLNIYAKLTNVQLPNLLNPIFWFERFVVITHLLEGIVAAFYAPSKKKMPIQYGTYTFFVGTVGLVELFAKEDE